MSDHITEDWKHRYAEACEEARRRQDEHVRTMIVMLEKKVDVLIQRCLETWEQADALKPVIGGIQVAVDKLKSDHSRLIERTKAKFEELEGKLGDGQLGE
jgi:hypothetical protein